MGGGGGGDTKTVQSSAPWGPAQKPLTDIMGAAGNMWQADVGSQVFPGTSVVPFSQPSQAAILRGTNMASQGNPAAGMFNQSVMQGLNRGGMNPAMFGALGNVDSTASGGMLNSNPFLNDALDFQSGKIGDQVADMFSGGGRQGSAAHGQSLARELAGLRYGAASQNYEAERGRQMQGIGMQADIGGAADQNARAWGALAPTADALRYADVDRLSKIGGTIEGKQGEIMNETKSKFDQQNQLPWDRLQQFLGIISPPSVNFGSSSSKGSTDTSFNPMSLAAIPMMAMGK